MASDFAAQMAEALSTEDKLVVLMGAFIESQATLNKVLEAQAQQQQAAAATSTTEATQDTERVERPPGLSRHYIPMSQRKGVERIPTFPGAYAQFEQWRLKVRGLMSTDLDVKRLIEWAQTQKWNELRYEDVPDELKHDVEAKSADIYGLLINVTSDEAFDMVTAVPDENGLRAWSKLVHHYGSMTRADKRQVLSRLLTPDRSKNYSEVFANQEAWTKLVQRYHEASESRIPEEILIVAYQGLLPQGIVKDMQALSTELETLEQVQAYTKRQVQAARNAEQGPFPMKAAQVTWDTEGEKVETEQDSVVQLVQAINNATDEGKTAIVYSLLKGGNGKGKGKGKGKEKLCWECNEKGHLSYDCPKKDKSKGGFGGKGAGGQWQQQNQGKGGKAGGKGKGGFKGGKPQLPPQAAYLLQHLFGQENSEEQAEMPAMSVIPVACATQVVQPMRGGEVPSKPMRKPTWSMPSPMVPMSNRFGAPDEEEGDDDMICGTCDLQVMSPQHFPECGQCPPQAQCNGTKKKMAPMPKKAKKLLGHELVQANMFVPMDHTEEPIPTMAVEQKWAKEDGNWVCIQTDMDSGCVRSVAPLSMVPTCPVRESPGSRAGQRFLVADGSTVPNLGEKRLEGQSETGENIQHTFQMADVTSPLTSVGDLCDEGKAVLFGPRGGLVLDMATNAITPFPRLEGRYKWNIWVNTVQPEQQGSSSQSSQPRADFGRQGS